MLHPSLPSLLPRTLAYLALAPIAAAQIVIEPAGTPFLDIFGNQPVPMVDDSELTVTAAALAAAGFTGNELLPLADIRIGNNGAVIWNNAVGHVGPVNALSLADMPPSVWPTYGNGGTYPGARFVCPMWDDLTPMSSYGHRDLDWLVVAGDLYIQWNNQDHSAAAGWGTIAFQMVVHSGVSIASQQPLVEFIYEDTLFDLSRYQNDGGSATIGFKNWGAVPNANDVEYGQAGGLGALSDPLAGSAGRQPKVSGWSSGENLGLPHALRIRGVGPTTYCGPGLTAGGCTPVISVSAQPSSTSALPCMLTVSGFDGARAGLFFYGFSELAPLPWGPGASTFLCVGAPAQRMTLGNTGGSPGLCDGLLVEDLHAFQVASPGALGVPFVAGQRLYVQGWIRDPFAPLGTSLSDEIRLVVQ